jgi:cellulose synthase/poly-beta-1,6-N-acetylglucosamine synthase-like glycosyltransferase
MIQLVLFVFLALNTLYVFILSVGGHLYSRLKLSKAKRYHKIAIFVPCYKEDAVIVSTAKQLLTQQYPKEHYDVVVLADSLKEETLIKLRELDVITIPIVLEKSMKSRSIQVGFQTLPKNVYDIAIIVDGDNVLAPGFLEDINDLFDAGISVVQTQRVAKNSGTSMAVLDGISEAINNHLFRQGANGLGLSSALIGSGMSFPYDLLEEEINKIDTPVEDKALQIALSKRRQFIHYRKGTFTYDEKVDSPEAYKNQRRRWIAGQYQMLATYIGDATLNLFKGNINYFNIAVLHNIFPSRINSLILLTVLTPLITFFYRDTPSIILSWWAIFVFYIVALLLAVPKSYYSMKMVRAVFLLPTVVFKTIQAILQSKNANKKFIHTEHKTTEVDPNLIEKP